MTTVLYMMGLAKEALEDIAESNPAADNINKAIGILEDVIDELKKEK